MTYTIAEGSKGRPTDVCEVGIQGTNIEGNDLMTLLFFVRK